MKIAFDCQGTLMDETKVRDFFQWCVSKGFDVYIWSSSFGYAKNTAEALGHPMEKTITKISKFDVDMDESVYMDICVDDCYPKFLAAKKFIRVHELLALNDFANYEKIVKENNHLKE